ncbi:hypothetical protein Tco_1239324 [Tanacetum coccineum]
MVVDDVNFNKKKHVLPRGVTFKRKVVVTKGRKSVGKGKEKVSEGEAALANKNRDMEKGKGIMVEDDVDFNKKKHVLQRPTGIVIREGGNKAVRTRYVVLGLRAHDNLDQQPLALANRDQPNFLTPSTSLMKPRSDVKITDCVLTDCIAYVELWETNEAIFISQVVFL